MKNGAHGVTITRITFYGALPRWAAMDQDESIILRSISDRNLDVINDRNNRAGLSVIRPTVVAVIRIVRIIIRPVISVVLCLGRVVRIDGIHLSASADQKPKAGGAQQ